MDGMVAVQWIEPWILVNIAWAVEELVPMLQSLHERIGDRLYAIDAIHLPGYFSRGWRLVDTWIWREELAALTNLTTKKELHLCGDPACAECDDLYTLDLWQISKTMLHYGAQPADEFADPGATDEGTPSTAE